MKKLFSMVVIVLGLLLAGCASGANGGLSGGKPPELFLKIGNEKFETTLGTYCWKATCADTAGPVELLEGEKPISVKPGETISFEMDFEPKPNELHLELFTDQEQKEIELKDNSFTAPTEPGIYYYSYGAWWMDEKEENVSHGDAFYAFVIEVK